MLSAAQNLSSASTQILRGAQHDRRGQRVSKKPTSESVADGGLVPVLVEVSLLPTGRGQAPGPRIPSSPPLVPTP
ncbi:MAG: hypothetical protein ABI396_16075 [Ktedonobacteraceae bacterium]